MKNVFRTSVTLLLLISFFCSAKGEVRKTIHWPHNGDRVTKSHYEFVEMPADTTVWDFSHAIETGKSHDMRWMNMGDSLLVRIERGAQYTYTMHGDSLVWRFQESPLIGMRDSIAPMVMCGGLPAIGDSIITPYYFRGRYSGNNAIAYKGIHTTKTMAIGTLILPTDTVTDVIRVREITDGAMKASAHAVSSPIESEDGLLHHTVITDRWYSPKHRYEIAENISSIYSLNGRMLQEEYATFLCTPDAQEMALGKIDVPLTSPLLVGNGKGKIHSGLPLSDRVSVVIGADGINVLVNGNGNGLLSGNEVTVILSDVSGRVWASHAGNTASGCYSTNINTSSLPSSNYILYVGAGEEAISERFQIK